MASRAPALPRRGQNRKLFPMNTDNERRVLAEGKFLRLVAQSGWEWVERTNANDAAVIAAVTDDQRLILVEQYRIPLGRRVLDLPAGLTGDDPGTEGEAAIDAARRELFEEAGYEGSDWHFVLHGPASPGLTTESYSLFILRGAKKTGAGGGDYRENIEVHSVPLAELDDWLDAKRLSGVVIDPKIYVGRYFLERGCAGD
jgi:ADP-ribose pyrophosphatase